MKLRVIVLVVACLITSTCDSQPVRSHQITSIIPGTLSRAQLEALCKVDLSEIERVKNTTPGEVNKFYFNGELYSGWACSNNMDDKHKYRYSEYIDGIMVRQIGYFDNGQVDHDFRMNKGRSVGQQRMWMRDGHLYVDNNYNEFGEMHGPQLRWYKNHQLARDGYYENGKMIYDIEYDQSGSVK